MDTREFVQRGLDRVKQATIKATNGLTHNEVMWRPGPGCNSIGLILFHMARFEDNYVRSRLLGKPQLWELEKWYEKLNLPITDTGSHYTVEQVAAFPAPDLKDLFAYADAVRAQTLEYIKDMTDEGFGKVINLPRLGDTTIGAVFSHIVVHLAQHAGEISYLRGMQRGMDK